LHEQQKMATILSTVDDKIDIITSQITKIENLKKGLTELLLIKGIGHAEYKTSDLLEIPKGWNGVQFAQIIENINYGPRFNAKDYSLSGNVKTIRGTDINKKGEIKYEQVPLALLDEEIITQHKLRENDIIMITTADCGLTGVFHNQKIPFIPSAYAVRIKLNNQLLPQYFKYFMQSQFALSQVKKFARKGTISNLPASDILKFSMPLPPIGEQKKIIEILNIVDEKLALLNTKKHFYSELKLGLMQQLLSGKMRVNTYQEQSAVA